MIAGLSAAEWIAIAGTAATFLLALAAFLSLWQGRKVGEATQAQAAATTRQAEATSREAEATAREAEATTQQAELAARALALQLEPRLIPLGRNLTVGEREDVGGDIQQFIVLPVYIQLANAGNGVAMIDSITARAEHLGEARALFPPAIRPGDFATIRLTFSFAEAIRPGDRIRIEIVYYGGADAEPRRLIFDALSLQGDEWEVTLIEPRPRPSA